MVTIYISDRRTRGTVMRIAILSRNRNLYSTRRLAEACRDAGHEPVILDVLRCYMDIAPSKPEMHFKGEACPTYDAVIPRIGASVTFYGTAVLRQFEVMGSFPLNESVAISRSRDKLRSLQLLARKGVGLPNTGFAHHPDDIQDLIKMVGAHTFIAVTNAVVQTLEEKVLFSSDFLNVQKNKIIVIAPEAMVKPVS